MTGGVDPSLAQRLNQLPQVAHATGLRQGFASVAGEEMYAYAKRNLFDPLDMVSSGKTRPCVRALRRRLIRSMPARMLPHWSLPPTCSRTPARR